MEGEKWRTGLPLSAVTGLDATTRAAEVHLRIEFFQAWCLPAGSQDCQFKDSGIGSASIFCGNPVFGTIRRSAVLKVARCDVAMMFPPYSRLLLFPPIAPSRNR